MSFHKKICALWGCMVLGVSWPAMSQGPIGGSAPEPKEAVSYEVMMASLPKQYHSTMIYVEELEKIKSVIEAIKNNRPLPGDEGDLEQDAFQQAEQAPAPEFVSYTYPQFYLTSIVYHTPNQWAIWVNHRKITAQKQHVIPHLSIAVITPDYIKLTYDFAEDPRIKPVTQSADPHIQIDQKNRSVSAKLEPNQMFSLYSWQIFEGDITPVTKVFAPEKKDPTFDSLVKGAGEALLGDDGAVPENTGGAKNKNKNKKDIGSLLNRYKQLDGGV